MTFQNHISGSRNLLVYGITRCIAWFVLHALFRMNIEGRSHLPRNRAYVLLPKHQRWLDVPLVGLAVPGFLYFVAKKELFSHPLSRWFISSLGGLALNRRRLIKSRKTLHAIRHCLNENNGMVVFPEGTYYPGHVGPGNLGILKFIVSSANVPLIPVGIRYMPRSFRSIVTIRFGAPVEAAQAKSIESLLALIMRRMGELSGLTNLPP